MTEHRGALAEALDRMAHQLKNPLQAVAMNLEVIRMRVGREAPELWGELERYARAVDENVEVLDRRVRLLLALGRRSESDDAVAVEVEALARDFAEALHLDRERPAVRVEGRGPERPARARPGFLLEALLWAWEKARAADPPPSELPVRVERGKEAVRLALRLPAGAGDGPDATAGQPWRELARRAGGRAEASVEEGGLLLEVVLPAD